MGPGAFESLCEPSTKIEFLSYHTPVQFPHSSPVWPSNQMVWALLYWMPVPQAENPDNGLRILTPEGEYLPFNYSPVCGPATQVVRDLIISQMHPSNYLIRFLQYVFGCRIFFNRLQSFILIIIQWFWCPHKRKWAQVLLLHNLVLSCVVNLLLL